MRYIVTSLSTRVGHLANLSMLYSSKQSKKRKNNNHKNNKIRRLSFHYSCEYCHQIWLSYILYDNNIKSFHLFQDGTQQPIQSLIGHPVCIHTTHTYTILHSLKNQP